MVLIEIGIQAGIFVSGKPIVVDRGKVDYGEEVNGILYYRLYKEYDKHTSVNGTTFYDLHNFKLIQEEHSFRSKKYEIATFKVYVEAADGSDIEQTVSSKIQYIKDGFNRTEYRKDVREFVNSLSLIDLIKC